MNFIDYLIENNISLRELAVSCDMPYASSYHNTEKPETIKAVN